MMFHEGRKVEKKSGSSENSRRKKLDFSLKIDPISSQKSGPNQICYENYSKYATQGSLAVHGLIFAPFWDPPGPFF